MKRFFFLFILMSFTFTAFIMHSGAYYKTKDLNKYIKKIEKDVKKSSKKLNEAYEECTLINNFVQNRDIDINIQKSLNMHYEALSKNVEELNIIFTNILAITEEYKTAIKGQKTISSDEPEYKKVKQWNRTLKNEVKNCKPLIEAGSKNHEKFITIVNEKKLITEYDIKKLFSKLDDGIPKLEKTIEDLKIHSAEFNKYVEGDDLIRINKLIQIILNDLNIEKEKLTEIKNETSIILETKERITYLDEEYDKAGELMDRYNKCAKNIKKLDKKYNNIIDEINKKLEEENEKKN